MAVRSWMAASALAGTLALLAGTAQAAQGPFAGETAFGDSLSDGGNVSILEGLPTLMRFTTNPGLTTVEDVAAYYGLPLTPSLRGGTNYAFGGAGVTSNSPGTGNSVPTETQQITSYLAANPKVNPDELFTVFGGANDIFYHGTAVAAGQFAANLGVPGSANAFAQLEGVAAAETPAQALTAIQAAATQELTLINGLQKAGARYVVVFNLPNTSLTPSAAAGEALVPGTIAEQSTLSNAFNSVLNAGLANMKVGIIPVNTYALFNETLANARAFGYVNTTTPVCTTGSSLNCTPQTLVAGGTPQTYVFADGVHPTSFTHQLFADVVESEIRAPQQVSLIAEEPLASLESERDAVTGQLLSDQDYGQPGVHVFATGGYLAQHFSGQSDTPSANSDDGFVTAGVDDQINPQLSLGGEISGGGASETLGGDLRRFHTNTIMGSVFAQYTLGPAYVLGQGGIGFIDFDQIQRQFAVGPVTRTENGSVGGQTWLGAASGGYWFGGRTLRVGPFLGVSYEHVHVDEYQEDGFDATAMTFGPQDRESLLGEAGARLQGDLPVAGLRLRPFVEVAYAYDGLAYRRDVVGGLKTLNGEFAIPGYRPDRQWGEAQAGVDAPLSAHWDAYVSYQGRFAGASSSYDGGRVGVRYSF